MLAIDLCYRSRIARQQRCRTTRQSQCMLDRRSSTNNIYSSRRCSICCNAVTLFLREVDIPIFHTTNGDTANSVSTYRGMKLYKLFFGHMADELCDAPRIYRLLPNVHECTT